LDGVVYGGTLARGAVSISVAGSSTVYPVMSKWALMATGMPENPNLLVGCCMFTPASPQLHPKLTPG